MTKTNIEYYAVQSDSAEGLGDNVNEKLSQGWNLQGGVSITTVLATPDKPGQQPQEAWVMWAQAVVRDRKPD